MASAMSMIGADDDDELTSTDIPGASNSNPPIEQAKIPLGSRAELTKLFSYPNHRVSFQRTGANIDDNHPTESVDKEEHNNETPLELEQTIQHYLTSSILRDGYFESEIQIHIAKSIPQNLSNDFKSKEHERNNDRFYAYISGNAAATYSQVLPRFLEIGKLGLRACQRVQDDGLWRENWRFFLPLGLPLTRHWTVELLHFPPIYTLEEDQDYLASRSTQRWRQLLTINSGNELGPMKTADLVSSTLRSNNDKYEPTDAFQAIIDIVPIAAPSSDGKNMEDVYPYFQDYIRAALGFWASKKVGGTQDTQTSKPVIAFGWPVKCWVEANQKQSHRNNGYETPMTMPRNIEQGNGSDPFCLEVLSLTRIPIETDMEDHVTTSAQVLIANHPSYLYNAGKRMESKTVESLSDEDSSLLEKIMIQDLIAARWQVRMGLDPYKDPHRILEECCQFWRDDSRSGEIRALINKQAFILQQQ